MIRKLVVVLLTGVMCLVGLTSALAVTYNEAPMLRTLVAAGELPPVEERLPEEPFVVKAQEIGQYGGELHLLAISPTTWREVVQFGTEGLFMIDRSCLEALPDVAKAYQYSEDGKTFTIYLRKGLKWSDGVPFTADDILFWWEDVILNPELMPVIPKGWKPGGKPMEVEKVDEYQVCLHFAAPFRLLDGKLALEGNKHIEGLYLPKHVLKKYHIKYNPKANELAKEEGYDSWTQLFMKKMEYRAVYQPVHLPTFNAWITKKVTPTMIVFERNPYYFKVDTAGNQLPYIDRKVGLIIPTKETRMLKLMSGEIDMYTADTTLADYLMLKPYEKDGDYSIWLTEGLLSSECAYFFNQTYEKDPVIGKALRDIRVRRALSLAINREEIIEVIYQGRGTPGQFSANPDCSFYEEEWSKTYAEYDPERANNLLDEAGFKWDRNNEWRLRPDSKVLTIVITLDPAIHDFASITELVKEYWEKVGVKTLLHAVSKNMVWEIATAGTHQIMVMVGGDSHERDIYQYGFWSGSWQAWCGKWKTWWITNGESGIEPPEEVKEFFSLLDKLRTFSTWGKEREQIVKRIFTIWSENLWTVATVGLAPAPALAKNGLQNVDKEVQAGHGPLAHNAEAWFWKQ